MLFARTGERTFGQARNGSLGAALKKEKTRGFTLFPTSSEDEFFQTKRVWSKKIKDRVLASYLVPYLSKVATLHQKIILVDAFAGPGHFEDGTKGSPLILCDAADQYVPDQYLGIFVNRKGDHHRKLEKALKARIDDGRAICIHGNARKLLQELGPLLQTQTVFVYLDPFGLAGCEFDTLKIFLMRSKAYSTEILINVSPKAIHRLAAQDAIQSGRITDQVKALNDRLTRVLGGDYWVAMLSDESRMPAERVANVVKEYQKRLAQYLPYVGSCPVQESEGTAIKYYMVFCSRHPDALLLMNDQMCAAYNQYMHEGWTEGTLFQHTDWRTHRDMTKLEEVIMERIGKRSFGRKELNVHIVMDHFMRWTTVEYRDAVKRLHGQGRLDFDDVRGTKRLNDDSLLHLPKPVAARVQHSA